MLRRVSLNLAIAISFGFSTIWSADHQSAQLSGDTTALPTKDSLRAILATQRGVFKKQEEEQKQLLHDTKQAYVFTGALLVLNAFNSALSFVPIESRPSMAEALNILEGAVQQTHKQLNEMKKNTPDNLLPHLEMRTTALAPLQACINKQGPHVLEDANLTTYDT